MTLAVLPSSTPDSVLVDALTALVEIAGSASVFALALLLLFAIFAAVAVGSAAPDKRSKVALRVLELLSRTKHPPG